VNLGLDEHVNLDSLFHRWEPRCKLIGLIALIFAFSFVQDLRLLPAMLAITSILYALSQLPLSFLLTRLRYPGYFILILVILLPFLTGTNILVHIGPFALRQEGLLASLLIITKFVSILTIGLVLFSTAPFLTTIKAIRSLGLPSILSDMTFLSYRYLNQIGDDLATMETAMGLRGFRVRRLCVTVLTTLTSLAGTILVRSYERSERVYKAMVLRGYGGSMPLHDMFHTSPRDAMILGGIFLTAVGFVIVELIFRGLGG